MISEGYLGNAGWRGVMHHRVSCELTINFTNRTFLMTFCLICFCQPFRYVRLTRADETYPHLTRRPMVWLGLLILIKFELAELADWCGPNH